MPTVSVSSKALFDILREPLNLGECNNDEFAQFIDKLAFEYGLEFDGIENDGAVEKLRIEVPANRYDLLCMESIADALIRFKHPAKLPLLMIKHSDEEPVTLTVRKNVENVRPYCVSAIFRDVIFDSASFSSFIDLQDKLHQNIGRRRQLVAIGTHDLDTIKAPFVYDALPKKNGFSFVPLNQERSVDGEGMFELLADTYLKPYLPIIADFDVCPVIMDGEGRVCSIPPIINADFCKLSEKTRNIFVEITAVDFHKATIVLDTICTFFAVKTQGQFTVTPVNVVYEYELPALIKETVGTNENRILTPALNLNTFIVSLAYVKKLIGVSDLRMEDVISKYLVQMGLLAEKIDSDQFKVQCPISRRDILHACDIAEDIAIAYGYNNIAYKATKAVQLQDISNISERIRRDAANCGWKECLTFGLVSSCDCYKGIRRTMPDNERPTKNSGEYNWARLPIVVSEPKTREFEIVRTTLIPGLLRTVSSNQAAVLPIRIFEVGETGCINSHYDNRAEQTRHFGAIYADAGRSGLEIVHGLLDHVLQRLKLSAAYMESSGSNDIGTYWLSEATDGPFLEKRCVKILAKFAKLPDRVFELGLMGTVHPDVLAYFSIPFPCSLFELSIDPILQGFGVLDVAMP